MSAHPFLAVKIVTIQLKADYKHNLIMKLVKTSQLMVKKTEEGQWKATKKWEENGRR
jgi:hypothetical protein